MSAQLLQRKGGSAGTAVRDEDGVTARPVPFPARNSDEASRELFVDPRIAERRLTAKLAYLPSDPYGLDYPPDLEERVLATIARNKDSPPAESNARFRTEILAIRNSPVDSSDEEEEFVCTPLSARAATNTAPPTVEPYLTQRGAAETLFLLHNSSQPHLFAMCQGLVCRPADPYPGTYIFDLENDDLLKSFPQKALFFPVVKLLKEEVIRRASQLKIRPFRKSATKPEIIEWLKDHSVTDPLDEAFLRFEAGKTYRAIVTQAEEAAAVERGGLATKNWSGVKPWMRLYHAATSDEARVLLARNDQVMSREELDARNSDARPPTYYEKVAELYNSEVIYISSALPDLHSTFADSMVLAFDEMPGGAITADEAKTRLGEARAKMISVSFYLLVWVSVTVSFAPDRTLVAYLSLAPDYQGLRAKRQWLWPARRVRRGLWSV
jgi:hypothetical protein